DKTYARIGNGDVIFAGGNVYVGASDDTHVFELSGALAGGLVGVGGSVGIMLVGKDTQATIGNSQVDALGNTSALANLFDGGIAGGFVGVSGAVDVGTVNNNISAKIDAGATVDAEDNIEINAVGIKNISGFDISGAGGFVGVGGAVSVWSIGAQIQKSTKDQ